MTTPILYGIPSLAVFNTYCPVSSRWWVNFWGTTCFLLNTC